MIGHLKGIWELKQEKLGTGKVFPTLANALGFFLFSATLSIFLPPVFACALLSASKALSPDNTVGSLRSKMTSSERPSLAFWPAQPPGTLVISFPYLMLLHGAVLPALYTVICSSSVFPPTTYAP